MPGIRVKLVYILIAVLACAASSSGLEQASSLDNFYGSEIVIPETAPRVIANAAEDLAAHLSRATGKSFSIGSAASRGIFLFTSGSRNVPASIVSALKGKGKEAFLLRSEGKNRLWIVGNSASGVEHGVYTYLDRLGFRWFFPSEEWTVIPSLKSIAVEANFVSSPAFHQRDFFGTGGYGGRLPVDPEMTMQKRVETWKRRNLLGGEIRIFGHAGEAFNMAHKQELIAHPEYLAEIGGKRQEWSPGTKPCYSNPGLIDLYVKDRLAAFKGLYEQDPDGPSSFAVSVEPSDGGGHCECAECRKIGSVSDRVFSLANRVARAIATAYPGRHVSLFAYNEHAAVPSIPLEPNVYVSIVPYGFQRTGMSPEELIEAWGKKVKQMGIYDYWSIPDWSQNMPDMDFIKTPAEKIRFWHKNNVYGFLGESTTSTGSMGVAWYLSSRLLWNPDVDVKVLLDDFYTKAFGQSAAPMKRMLERWASGFYLSNHELALSCRDLIEADRLCKSKDVMARIDDYKRYVQYLRLWYEYTSAKPDTGERRKAVRDLLFWIWRNYDSPMIQTFRMHQLVVNRYESRDIELAKEFDFKNVDFWKTLTPVTHDELNAVMDTCKQKYEPLNFESRQYSDNLVPLKEGHGLPGAQKDSYVHLYYMWGQYNFVFMVPEDNPSLTFIMQVGKMPSSYPGDRFTIRDASKQKIFTLTIPADAQPHEIKVPFARPGRYYLEIYDQKASFNLDVPKGIPFVATDRIVLADVTARVYFYVPDGLKTFAMYTNSATPLKIFDSQGRQQQYQGNNLIVVQVPQGEDGKIWYLTGHKSYGASPIFLNIPKIYAWDADAMMIPKEVAGDRK